MGVIKDTKSMAFDIRLIDWNLKYGVLTPDEVKKHRESLQDLAHEADRLEIDDEGLAPIMNGTSDSGH